MEFAKKLLKDKILQSGEKTPPAQHREPWRCQQKWGVSVTEWETGKG